MTTVISGDRTPAATSMTPTCVIARSRRRGSICCADVRTARSATVTSVARRLVTMLAVLYAAATLLSSEPSDEGAMCRDADHVRVRKEVAVEIVEPAQVVFPWVGEPHRILRGSRVH